MTVKPLLRPNSASKLDTFTSTVWVLSRLMVCVHVALVGVVRRQAVHHNVAAGGAASQFVEGVISAECLHLGADRDHNAGLQLRERGEVAVDHREILDFLAGAASRLPPAR
jgi:hypothetical protein